MSRGIVRWGNLAPAMKFTFKRTMEGALNTVWAPAYSPGYPIG